jgi:uncharacterized protein YndB with AHSA1/START domain
MDFSKLTARASIRIHSAPADVFAAFADPAKMSMFWFNRLDDGLTAGEKARWSLGAGPDAYAFDVKVKEIREAETIVIEWQGTNGHYTQVVLRFENTGSGDTILSVEESGFSGSNDAIVNQVIDSTGGFNQVIVAAKALIEHGVTVNVVADHA